ncbi:MAG: ATP phosphoribosyltransferase [Bacteroidetes bacterium GWF2_42_66]|nr:MAG: ATP phosphoribosyltransferase [Bacteroidetes bacterium GWA2_42_15]OFY00972.1 MAG: ATP phosphoribosyltransferase [Bacteroidetes bacterium GWE2_42_39]OFY41812.1 MAG: ATP phosphoribosyltransferase [Bacteroidetes bacterium GWF2_42_66]HBL78019.1 ATP phosphoribosyltransferase [Prolixibacteraceae bacterium]HCR89841.1 ATP phosphoribosyltransferase [Prolixibacteraceae bacterium]
MTQLKIAIQNKGRLYEDSMELIKEAGINFSLGGRELLATAKNYPLDALFLRDDDIPQTVADGVADIGIVGENEVLEKKENVLVAKRLGFSKCRLSLAIPKSDEYPGLSYFNGKKIATSYPVILQDFLDKHDIKADIHVITGSVEIAPGIGLADAIFDIVSSGSTLVSNRLKEVEVVTPSEAVLIANPNLNDTQKAILNELVFRMESVQRAEGKKYILLNAPNNKIDEISAILPGMKSPTVTPLAEEGWSSIHSVISENEFWEIIGKLKNAGAQGILVVPIEKMIF